MAQKQVKETFTQQTCQRVAKRAVLGHFGHLMKDSEEEKEAENSYGGEQAVDSFLQKQQNFKIYREKEEVKAFNKNGKGRKPDKFSGKLDKK
eukprot:1357655-Ditylum_brightwellii.AAC.1